MKVKVLYSSLLALALTLTFAAQPASGEDAQAPANCQAISIDLTNPELVARLKNVIDSRPAGEIHVEEEGGGMERMRIAFQDFESTTADNPTPIKTTVTCVSGTCLGAGCAVVGCDPFTVNGQTGCSPCNCVPVPPAIICTTGSCTCEKTTVVTPPSPAPGSDGTTEP